MVLIPWRPVVRTLQRPIAWLAIAAGMAYVAFGLHGAEASAQPIPGIPYEELGVLNVRYHTLDLPRASGNGIDDDTLALQTLINYGYRERMVVLFPEGVYLVSDTLIMEQTETNANRRNYSHQLIGSTVGARPVIRLKPNSPGFAETDPAKTKAVLRYVGGCATSASSCSFDQWGTLRSVNFESGVRNLDIEIGAGNPGAIGLYFSASQFSFVEDMVIRVGSGFAGMQHVPGLSSVVGNITIEGGRYGIYNAKDGYTNGSTMTNMRFLNQSDCSLGFLRSEKTITIVGFEIVKAQPPAICIEPTRINYLALIDGKIHFENPSATAAITNPGKKVLTVNDLYVRNTSALYSDGAQQIAIPGYQPGAWYRASELYTLDARSSQPAYVDGAFVTQPNPIVGPITQASPPANLLENHSWGAADRSPDHLLALAQSPSQTGVCNALDQPNVRGNASHDDWAGLQSLLDRPECATVFLPRGRYYVSRPLVIPGDTSLLGITPRLTEIVASASSMPPALPSQAKAWKPTSQTPIVTTVDDRNARITLANLRIWFPTSPAEHDWFTALEWRAGPASIIKNVQVRPVWSTTKGSQPKADILFAGNAGGRWYGAGSLAIPENATLVSPLKRRILVDGVVGPLVFYNYNVEDGDAASADAEEGWQSEIVNSRNVVIYGAKFEDRNALRVRDSTNVGLFALTNSDMGIQWATNQYNPPGILGVNLGNKFIENSNRDSGQILFTERIDDTSTVIPFTYALSLYRVGVFNRGAFTYAAQVEPPTATPTATSVPPTATPTVTPTATATDMPTPTPTATSIPPTATGTVTPVPATPTSTSTSTATATHTAVPAAATSTATATATATAGPVGGGGCSDGAGNVLQNGNFEGGTEPWKFFTNGKGGFTTASPGYECGMAARVNIQKQGTNVQLYQHSFTIAPNTRYRLSFAAYSSSGNDVSLYLHPQNGGGNYGLNGHRIDLGTSWQSYVVEFVTTGFSQPTNNVRLRFWLSPYDAAGDIYWFDAVRLERLDTATGAAVPIPESPAQPTSTAGRGSLRGQILGAAGAPVAASFTVMLLGQDEAGQLYIYPVQSDPDGYYAVDGAQAGVYLHNIEPPVGYQPPEPVEIVIHDDRVTELRVMMESITPMNEGESQPDAAPEERAHHIYLPLVRDAPE